MGAHIVFVDDEEDLCELYVEFFEDVSSTVVTFTDPIQAIEYINATPPDFCVIDYRMPRMNGLELRARLPADLPCYLISGELGLECPDGFVRKFAKPIRYTELEELVATFSND